MKKYMIARNQRGVITISTIRIKDTYEEALGEAIKLCIDTNKLNPLLESNFISIWEVSSDEPPVNMKASKTLAQIFKTRLDETENTDFEGDYDE